MADTPVIARSNATKQSRSQRSILAALTLASILPLPATALTIEGDRIEAPLTETPGNAEAGHAIVGNRQVGLCVLCHAGPFSNDHFGGSIGPNLADVGSRLDEGQIRLRVADARHLNPDSVMPSYATTNNLNRVAQPFQGRPILSAQQIEDVVAYLTTLRNTP